MSITRGTGVVACRCTLRASREFVVVQSHQLRDGKLPVILRERGTEALSQSGRQLRAALGGELHSSLHKPVKQLKLGVR